MKISQSVMMKDDKKNDCDGDYNNKADNGNDYQDSV